MKREMRLDIRREWEGGCSEKLERRGYGLR